MVRELRGGDAREVNRQHFTWRDSQRRNQYEPLTLIFTLYPSQKATKLALAVLPHSLTSHNSKQETTNKRGATAIKKQ
jgi:hypothetical protein